ncbi:MAG: dihydroorotate dehydrogenase electron transfer subunit [Lentisphaeria bacterium]|nr:dihydroorotate dehydrogenase electron transfer subunit [Lentisphaeria bacterium]
MDFECRIKNNEALKSGYRRIVFDAPEVAARAKGGQFVHVQISPMRDRILRRPFSISNADPASGELTVVYKVVGRGTAELAQMRAGESCRILGPLGNAYTVPDAETFPILVAGGYGTAALYLTAKNAPRKGILLLGARTKDDLILVEDFERLGFEVRIATNDGSAGQRGFVTELLSGALSGRDKAKCMVYGCGPTPMLLALGRLTLDQEVRAELSLDQHMCCGVGACFACVVKIKDPASPDGWRYSRSCKEGPVYNATEVYYG